MLFFHFSELDKRQQRRSNVERQPEHQLQHQRVHPEPVRRLGHRKSRKIDLRFDTETEHQSADDETTKLVFEFRERPERRERRFVASHERQK